MIALKLEVHVDELAAKANKLQLGSTVVIIVAKTPDPSLTTSSDEAPEISSLKKVAESAKTVVHVTHEDDDDNIEKILPPAPKQRRPRHSAPAASSPIFEQVIKPPTRARHSDVGTNLICCSAKNITKPYNQCGNKIKFDYSLFGIVDPLCHRHSKLEDPRQGSFMAPFVDTGVEQPVDFSAWIPDDVCRPIQRALRKKIQQTQSHGEQPGYIYAYEIRDPNSNMFTIKVGRSEGNVVERLVAWKKSCPSKEIVLRGWWPGIDSNDCDQETVITLDDPLLSIHQRVLSSRKAKRCHQLEALIHLELRGREKHGQQTETKVNVQATLCKQRAGSEPPRSPSETTCSDFLASHREIFQFERFTLGEDIGKEWERIVQPVIEKWEMFLSAYAPNGGIY